MDVVIPELSGSRRFKAVEFPTALPGCCYTCRTHEGPFIDTGIQEDMFGAIYLCLKCISEMANEFNFATPRQVESLNRRLQKRFEETQFLKSQNEALKEENNGLRMAVASSVNDYDVRNAGSGLSDNEDKLESDSESGTSESEGFDLFGDESSGHSEPSADK